jgi:hypothetical protein
MDLGQKIFIIWQQTEIISNLLDVAPLVGPPPIKIRVVMFCTLPLVAPSILQLLFGIVIKNNWMHMTNLLQVIK